MTDKTEAEAIAAIASGPAIPEIIRSESGREFLVLPGREGQWTHHDVSEPNAVPKVLPDHINQGVTLQTVDSLVDYVNRFKTTNSVLFANISTNSIVAALDYHEASAFDGGNFQAAGDHQPVAHNATLTLPYSEEWKTWTGADKRMANQIDFARFLEQHAGDVKAPDGASLLEVCRDLQATRKVDFKRAVRTASGNESFTYSDETNATSGGVELPHRFLLELPVYFDGASVELYAYLRWKLDDAVLTLGVELIRPESVRQAVFKQIVGEAAERAAVPAVFGMIGSRPS